jgi:hypothetical protein
MERSYGDASQAGALSQAKIKVGDNYVGPSAEAAAKVLESSKRTDGLGRYSWAYTLARDTTASGTDPDRTRHRHLPVWDAPQRRGCMRSR